jgi:two-component system, NtrC family, sensor kinase
MAVAVIKDITELKSPEDRTLHQRRMETAGRLAAGLAHELNSPVQFVGDNLHFLQDGFSALAPAITGHSAAVAGKPVDIPYLLEEFPRALAQSLEGIDRIAATVKALQAFVQAKDPLVPVEINLLVEEALLLARSDYKYVADLKTDLAPDLPTVTCRRAELQHAVLELIHGAIAAVNSASVSERDRRVISLSTRQVNERVELAIFHDCAAASDAPADPGVILIRSIAEKLGGELVPAEEPGHGFTLVLPTRLAATVA